MLHSDAGKSARCIIIASDCQLYIHVFPKQAADVCFLMFPSDVFDTGIRTTQYFFSYRFQLGFCCDCSQGASNFYQAPECYTLENQDFEF